MPSWRGAYPEGILYHLALAQKKSELSICQSLTTSYMRFRVHIYMFLGVLKADEFIACNFVALKEEATMGK
jgi:hypothetical protein